MRYRLDHQPLELRWKMSWKRADAEMHYCKAALEGIGKLSHCIGAEGFVGSLSAVFLAFCLVWEGNGERA